MTCQSCRVNGRQLTLLWTSLTGQIGERGLAADEGSAG